jgi:hypothetical protein
MTLFRLLILVFNVAVAVFLIYRMLTVAKQPMERSKKVLIMTGGIMLLLAPFGIFFRFFMPGIQYLLIYPVAVGLFLYLTKQI